MEKTFEEIFSSLSEDKKEKKDDKHVEKKAGATSVYDSNSTQMRLKPKSGEFITINYDELAVFLKGSLGRTFTKMSARKFAEDLRKFLGLYTENEAPKEEEK